MRIRRMTAEDVSQVETIERVSFSRPWSRQSFLDALILPDTVFLVAEKPAVNSAGDSGTVIVGYIGMYTSLDEGEITNVAVWDIFRGQGIGRALVSAMQREAGIAKIKRVVLEVRVSNTSAIHVYEKQGFRSLGFRRNFYDFPREDALIMEWIAE